MKKKTVINTEKHEVWVIRREVLAEESREHQESEAQSEALMALPEDQPDNDEPNAQKNH